ncbi:hypothetical protein [Bacillus paramycoides]|uniref:hypothetical protein n=1 Tax=Bacillus paramycoides TaxID=2026194 RepID=UPI0037F2BAA7
MKVVYKNAIAGNVIYSEDHGDIPGLMAILKETKHVKMGVLNYEVKKYSLEYAQYSTKSKEMKSELVILLNQKF